MEYLVAEVLELAENAGRDNKISWNNILQLALRNYEELNMLLLEVLITYGCVWFNIQFVLLSKKTEQKR